MDIVVSLDRFVSGSRACVLSWLRFDVCTIHTLMCGNVGDHHLDPLMRGELAGTPGRFHGLMPLAARSGAFTFSLASAMKASARRSYSSCHAHASCAFLSHTPYASFLTYCMPIKP